jgi:cell division protein FtsZ
MIFANEQVTATADPSTPVLEAFKRANELISNSVRAAYYAFAGGTVMGLPFSDICALVRDRSDTCVLLAASSGADDRVSEITTALMSHPSLSSPAMLTEANVISVYVLGGANLAMLDINRLVDAIGRECGSVPLLMGAAIEPCLEGVLMVAVIVGQPQESRHERRHEELPPGRGESPIGDLNDGSATRRPPSRMLPPPPELTPERAMEIRDHQAGRKPRKSSQRMRQTQLALDIAAKGRFDKAEPTIHRGEDLDVPTYVRRGVALN